jgi:cytosine/adenosine deaminase-related metal-dependent hydrolase
VPTFSGRLLLEDDVQEGTLDLEDGRVVAWREGETDPRATATGWIVPRPVNAHTHVADAFARDEPKPRTVPELVGPGGWKLSRLAKATEAELHQGIRRYVGEMAAIGTWRFIDFREGGVEGVRALRALQGDLEVEPFILGHPRAFDFEDEEARQLVKEADGIALSAVRDFGRQGDVEAWADAARAARKPFALHASECYVEELEDLLRYDPAFLVHCTMASKASLNDVADADVPVVVCPRSNAYFGMKTPLDRMLSVGLRVMVGTDNGMVADGDLLQELSLLKAWYPQVATADLLRMATVNPRRFFRQAVRVPKAGEALDHIVLPMQPFNQVAHKPLLGGT